ncbi:MAG TPA: DUF1800 domain-containing protein [Candidatus Eisenbacteria bacterium]
MNRRCLAWCLAVALLLLPGAGSGRAEERATSASPGSAPTAPDAATAARIASFEAMIDARREVPALSTLSVRPGTDGDPHPGGAVAAYGWRQHDGPLTIEDAAHLLNRALVGPRFEEFQWAVARGLPGTVHDLLQDPPTPAAPGAWATEPVPNQSTWTQAQKDSLDAVYRERQRLLRMWWTRTIATEPASLRETMTLFWHDHFATRMAVVYTPQSMYIQNALLRQHALGNFRTLARAICTDPAMLVMLDGRLNRKQSPNENFSREMLELFTMGEGSGYTQADVSNAARACTGWQTDGTTSYLTASRYDTGTKTILGQTGPWGMDDFVRIIFEQDATAEYLCGKLYRWFVDDEPAASDIHELAVTLRANDYEIRPVLEKIFLSEHLVSARLRGSIVRDGVDLYAGQARRWHLVGFDPMITSPQWQRNWITNQMNTYGQILLDPPDVSGWPGHRNWINSNSLPNRKRYSVMIVDGRSSQNQPFGFQLDVNVETRRFRDPNDVNLLVDDLALLCFGQKPTQLVHDQLVAELLQGQLPYNWSIDDPNAVPRLQDLYRLAMRLPDYQLK